MTDDAAEYAAAATPRASDRDLRREAAARYRRLGWKSELYVRLRLLLAPMIETAGCVPPRGDILDLGCGQGLFALLVRLKYPGRRILGLDRDGARIRVASAVVDDSQAEFKVGNIESVEWGTYSVVTIIDVLHHIPFEVQRALIHRVRRGLAPGGVVLIKELHTRPRWKYLFHYVQDTLSYRSPLFFRSRADMVALLTDAGFDVRVVDVAKGRPHPHIIYICTVATRPSGSTEDPTGDVLV
jgi:2-polyprenyl-3-methyl-5-hydroxy-6-metoxy-1,4-benzoquinol methylase